MSPNQDAYWRAKQLCEIPNGRMGPQIVRRLKNRPKGPSQLDSWCNPTGHWDERIRNKYKDLVGQVFFKSNDRQLDGQDTDALDAALDYWRSYNANFYRSTPVLFKFVGNADSSGSAAYNLQLGRDRANVVKRRFDEAFSGYPYYLSAAESLGESKASKSDFAGSRRVDIFTSFVIPIDRSEKFDDQILKGKYRGERSSKFKIRTFLGAGVSLGPLGGNVLSIEIVDPRTERTAMFVLTSESVGASIGINRPTGYSDIDTKDFITVDDFEGNGGIISASAGVAGGQVLRFDGPKERGITKESVVVGLDGWDLNVGFTSDVIGYWHRVGE